MFDRCVQVVQLFVAYAASNHATKQKAATGALVLEEFRKCRKGLPPSYFYNSALSSSLDLSHELQLFRQGNVCKEENEVGKKCLDTCLTGPLVFSWLRYPFVLDPAAKAKLVEISFKQHQLYISLLTVRRTNLLEDALAQVHQMT